MNPETPTLITGDFNICFMNNGGNRIWNEAADDRVNPHSRWAY